MRIAVMGLAVLYALSIPSMQAAQQDGKPQKSLSVSFPGAAWSVAIDSPGFTVVQDQMQPDGRKYFMADNRTSGMVLSLTLEHSATPADLNLCRQSLQARLTASGPFQITHPVSRDVNGVPVAEYLIAQVQGVEFDQGNMFACMVSGDTYIDVHISKIIYDPKDEPTFEALLKTVRIRGGAPAAPAETSAGSSFGIPTGTPAGNTAEVLFDRGNAAFFKRDYPDAIGPYQQAYQMEKEHVSLDQTSIRVLLDNLGMAYGITGNAVKAREVFDYGISKDPGYPLFYYNIACIYGDKNDAENSLAFLRKAFANQRNRIAGERMPDPRTDDSFAGLMKNDQFAKDITALVSGAK